jgi:N-carbamoylputrescine amidase
MSSIDRVMKKEKIIATICELPNEAEPFIAAWQRLVMHVGRHQSDVAVLPEMPFAPWVAAFGDFDPAVWSNAVALHDEWLPRLAGLGRATVLSSRPVTKDGRRLNEAFIWQVERGYQATHYKY